MKKFVLVVSVVLLTGVGLVAAQMDAPDLSAFMGVLLDAQSTYYAEHGRFAQITGVLVSPICPPDQAACVTLPTPPDGVTVTVNVYDSPSGPGYETIAEYRDSETGVLWRRVVNNGPEAWRTRGWFVPPTPGVFISPLETP